MKDKIAGYRTMLGFNQQEMTEKLGISKQAYRMKEIGKTQFNDNEKLEIKEMLKSVFPNITIDEIIFSQNVS